jgi:hypothetical protein
MAEGQQVLIQSHSTVLTNYNSFTVKKMTDTTLTNQGTKVNLISSETNWSSLTISSLLVQGLDLAKFPWAPYITGNTITHKLSRSQKLIHSLTVNSAPLLTLEERKLSVATSLKRLSFCN